MIMRHENNRFPAGLSRDTDERRQPRSLDLALRRMGFRDRGENDGQRSLPATWQRRTDDPVPDWRPL